jgi:hypothetical protein
VPQSFARPNFTVIRYEANNLAASAADSGFCSRLLVEHVQGPATFYGTFSLGPVDINI